MIPVETAPMTTTAPVEPSHPLANVLVDGFRTEVQRFPENAEAVYTRQHQVFRSLSPRNTLQEWFTDDIALTQLRMERAAKIERRLRDRSALRAESFWDDDRRLLAEDLGAKLPKDPARTVGRLQATPQGCDWLIGRWALLLEIAAAGQAWNERQTALVLDLLGLPKDLREDAVITPRLADPAGLARCEIARLKDQRNQVAEADELDRALAMADLVEPDTAEFRELRRYEAGLHRRMKWSMAQLEFVPKFAEPHPDLVRDRELNRFLASQRDATPKPEPEVTEEPIPPEAIGPIPAREPEPEPAPEPEPEPAPVVRSDRPDPKKLRARQKTHQRRNDRLDR